MRNFRLDGKLTNRGTIRERYTCTPMHKMFRLLDQLRLEAHLGIDDCADVLHITPLAFKFWRKGAEPSVRRKGDIRVCIRAIRHGLRTGVVPMADTSRMGVKLAREKQILQFLVKTARRQKKIGLPEVSQEAKRKLDEWKKIKAFETPRAVPSSGLRGVRRQAHGVHKAGNPGDEESTS